MLQAAHNPDLLPIPEYVMNDTVRNWTSEEESVYFFKFANGDYDPLVLHDSVELRERELQKKTGFDEWLVQNDKEIPASFRENSDDMRFLHATKGDFVATYDEMVEQEKYYDDHVVEMFSKHAEFEELLNRGLIYGLGRDEYMRPNIVMNVRRILDAGLDMSRFIDLYEYLMHYTMIHAMVRGKIETVNFIIDCKGVSVYEFPITELSGMGKRVSSAFKVVVHNVIITDLNWLLKAGVNVISTFVPDRVLAKVSYHSNNGASHTNKFIAAD